MLVGKPALPVDEPGFLSNADARSIDNPLLDMVEDAGNEPGVQYLHPVILSKIIDFSLKQDV